MSRGAVVAAFVALLGLVNGAVHAEEAPVQIRMNGVPVEDWGDHDYYPRDMRRKARAGRVALAYSIDGKGRATNVVVLASDDTKFEPSATRLIKNLKFRVPLDWESSGANWQRHRIQVNFQIRGQGKLPIWEEGSEAIILTTTGGGLN